jgi:hypothetical protein
MATAPQRASSKLSGELPVFMPHLQLDADGIAVLDGCASTIEALDRLEQRALLIEATRLVAHALPAREKVWWACMCSRHTAASGTDPATEASLREAAEEWVRQQTDAQRRVAMDRAQQAGFTSAEAWAAVAAFWSGDSMAPLEAPKVPPEPHFAGLAAAGSVALAAARGNATLHTGRLKRFLISGRDIAQGGAGRLEPEST